MAEKVATRTMVLGATDGFRYIGFCPPLTDEEMDALSMPDCETGVDYVNGLVSVERHSSDNSMDVGYWVEGTDFEVDASFIAYSQRVARHLGNIQLHETVRPIGPGSATGQILRGVPPQY